MYIDNLDSILAFKQGDEADCYEFTNQITYLVIVKFSTFVLRFLVDFEAFE